MSKNIRNLLTDPRISGLTDEIDVIQGDITTINNTLTTIQNDITNIDNSITTINNTLTTVQNDITNIDNSITTINTSITTINGNLITLNTDVGTAQADILALQNSVNNLGYFTLNGTLSMIENATGTSGLMTYRAVKINGIVTLTIYYYSSTMSNVNYWINTTPLNAQIRPITPAACPVLCMVGPGLNVFDSDIMGSCIIQTNGTLYIYRESPPGTATWNTNNCGWYAFSLSYPTI